MADSLLHWKVPRSALRALGSAALAAAAAPTPEGTLAGAALGPMAGMAAGALRMTLAIVARRTVAALAVALAIGRALPVIPARLALGRTLIVAAALGAIGTGRLDRDARARGPFVTMTPIAPFPAEAASTTPARLALGCRQLQRLKRLRRGNEAFRKRSLRQLLAG
ncbi:MAG TPA: hypothetical protein VFO12_05655 [Sphingomicrobium sp.]|nr:hypothetical protein [Sphingomicrobium sp.]